MVIVAKRKVLGRLQQEIDHAPACRRSCSISIEQHSNTWGVEVMPYEVTGTAAPLHQLLLSRCGITLGEMFDLDALAADCAADGVSEMLFVAPPLPIVGAVNSPINPLAVK